MNKTIVDRINEVCSLEAGWLDGEGEAVDVNPAWVEQVVIALMNAGLSKPAIFPTSDGYVQLEWDDGRTVIVE